MSTVNSWGLRPFALCAMIAACQSPATPDAECGAGRPCSGGLVCDPATARCVAGAADLASDASAPPAPPAGMVTVVGGSYLMGTSPTQGQPGYDPESQSEEQPAHSVTVPTFYLDQTEVTTAAFKACVDAGRCTAPNTGSLCNWGQADKADHPINCVDFTQASVYCSWAQKRLPTEEEWEYAARGAGGSRYTWGADAPDQQLCWRRDLIPCDGGTCSLGTCAVGQSERTLLGARAAQGVADLAGDVWEWTATPYCGPYGGPRACGTKYVVRGGGWGVSDRKLQRAAFRGYNEATDRYVSIGLRCARTP